MKKEINNIISNIKNKKSILYFLVSDSKNIPNAIMFNTYTLAKTLKDLGYNTKMVYQSNIENEGEFIGVGEWLGREYANLEHLDIAETEITFTPSDFIFVPEVLYFFIDELHHYKVTSDIILISNNINSLFSTLEPGQPLSINKVKAVISFSEENTKIVKELLNYDDVQYYTINNFISDDFDNKKPISEKELTVSINSKNEKFVKNVINAFYTLAPNYNFISFSVLANMPYKDYVEKVNSSRFIVWEDVDSVSLNSLKECLSSNSIILAVPTHFESELYEEQTVVWCNNPFDIAVRLKSLITISINKEDQFLLDKIENRPSYKVDFANSVLDTFNNISSNRIDKLNTLISK